MTYQDKENACYILLGALIKGGTKYNQIHLVWQNTPALHKS